MYKYVLLMNQDHHHVQKKSKKKFFLVGHFVSCLGHILGSKSTDGGQKGQYTPYLNRSHRARSIGTLLDPIAQKFFRARSARKKF